MVEERIFYQLVSLLERYVNGLCAFPPGVADGLLSVIVTLSENPLWYFREPCCKKESSTLVCMISILEQRMSLLNKKSVSFHFCSYTFSFVLFWIVN